MTRFSLLLAAAVVATLATQASAQAGFPPASQGAGPVRLAMGPAPLGATTVFPCAPAATGATTGRGFSPAGARAGEAGQQAADAVIPLRSVKPDACKSLSRSRI